MPERRLQSARGLGWAMPERAEAAARPQDGREAPAELPVAAVAEPA